MPPDHVINRKSAGEHGRVPGNFLARFWGTIRRRPRHARRESGQRVVEQARRIVHDRVVLAAEAKPQIALFSRRENERAVDVQVNRLRRKIERDPANPLFVQTVRGIGYRLVITT